MRHGSGGESRRNLMHEPPLKDIAKRDFLRKEAGELRQQILVESGWALAVVICRGPTRLSLASAGLGMASNSGALGSCQRRSVHELSSTASADIEYSRSYE